MPHDPISTRLDRLRPTTLGKARQDADTVTMTTRATDLSLPAGVRLGPEGLEVATCHFVKGLRMVELVGVMHVADIEFWDGVAALVDERLDEGWTVHSEFITGGPKRPYLTPLMTRLKRALGRKGLVTQPEALDYASGRIQIHDFTWQQMVAAVGPVKANVLMVGSVLAHAMMAAVSADTRSDLFGKSFVERSSGFTENTMGEMHEARETIALDAVEAEAGDVTTLWGAAHLARMTRTLVDRGWTLHAVEWRQALRHTTDEEQVA